MPDVTAAIIKTLPGLAKWGYKKYQQSHTDFTNIARATLTTVLIKRNENFHIVQ